MVSYLLHEYCIYCMYGSRHGHNTNVKSLKNKRDELSYMMKTRRHSSESSVYCFTETWIDPFTRHSAVLHSGYTLRKDDRSPEPSGKSKGGGVCFMISQRWCNDSSVLSTTCSPELETLIIKCKLFYLPR